MHHQNILVTTLILLSNVVALGEDPAPEARVVASASEPVLFAYGSWDKQVRTADGRTVVHCVDGKGGAGWNVQLDLSASDRMSPTMRVLVGAGNQAEHMALVLKDTQGHSARWVYQLPAPGSAVRSLVPSTGGTLISPAEREQGDLDLARISQWQIVGDWSAKPLDIQVEGLALGPAPAAAPAAASRPFDVLEALPLTEQIAMVHVVEGHVVHHRKGQKRAESHVELTPLDVNTAAAKSAWTIRSNDDPAYAAGRSPVVVGRKSKGIDFAWMIQGWDQVNQRALNTDPDHAKGHWLYLRLPTPMQAGKTYVIDGSPIPGVGSLTLAYNPTTSRSEAVHVNVEGYVPDTTKFAYVFHWAGDLGSVDLSWLKGRRFSLIDQATKKQVFSGTAEFRAPADQVETSQPNDTPHGNFLDAEVWQCDFSSVTTPGTYVVSVDGVGCSFPFQIGADVYREAFRTTARGLYHNRSGIALAKPYTEFERPAPANPKLTPGFAGKLIYTTSTMYDWKDQDAGDVAKITAGAKGPIDVAGFYQDAGDWDSYPHHLNVATALLFAYELAPRNFSDGELNIPESGNGVPDILDEAAWLPRFCYRLRHELLTKGYGTGGIGLRIAGDFTGKDEREDGTTRGSWEDDRTYYVSGEDAVTTMRYAAVAAHLAHALAIAKVADPDHIDWKQEAIAAWAWAEAHQSSFPWVIANAQDVRGDELYLSHRLYAAAALYRITGDVAYERQLYQDGDQLKLGDELWAERPYGLWLHSLGGGAKPTMPERAQHLREIALRSCEIRALETTAKRALRWGGGFSFPMVCGQQTTPLIMEGAIGFILLRERDPATAKRYRDAVATTCDYMLGGNALNQTWVTGLGVRHVNQVFHMDGWYNGKPTVHPGVVPYGPWRDSDAPGQGPWDVKWPNKSVYPAIGMWPGNERWFDNRNCPLSSEFTIHQNTCWAAATYGWLCAPIAR